MSDQPAPYCGTSANTTAPALKRVRIPHLREMKECGEMWAMLTAYDMYTAATFDEAGIPVLLIGDSASNNVFGNKSSLPVTVDELLPLVRAVSGAARRALVIADLPFGSYEASAEQCFHTSVRFMKEAGAHAVKLEGGEEMVPQVELLARSGIPVMAHIGFTPQSEHSLGGYRVQGRRGDAQRLVSAAKALEAAGAFAVLIEMVPEEVGAEITRSVAVPTVGIGAGSGCDAQVLVWQDMAGLRTGRLPRFVKQYAEVHGVLREAARDFAADVAAGTFPAPEHTF
ncbi:3-methyl-2-oxobutanoate hydroxymethyltransferase [Streptomyces acidicola]|uniref:3-methyl-2-oxobutanoate hydroxymethyltransferase n=1 Tax=Streptomyces acidicola TaxID=2596892 RepID=UPI00342CEB38